MWFAKKKPKESTKGCYVTVSSTQSQTSNTRITERNVTTKYDRNNASTTQNTTRKTVAHQQTSSRAAVAIRSNTTGFGELQNIFFNNSTSQFCDNISTSAIQAERPAFKINSNVRSSLPQSKKTQGVPANTIYNARGPIASYYREQTVSNTNPFSSPGKTNNSITATRMLDARPFNSPTISSLPSIRPMTTQAVKNQPAAILPATKIIIEPQSKISSAKLKSIRKPGIAVILNCVDFVKDPAMKRLGSDYDARLMEETLQLYKINIMERMTNPKLKHIERVVKVLSQKDFSHRACLIFVILSHGSAHDHIQANDGDCDIDKMILLPLLENVTLLDTPKIFIIQACKGPREVTHMQTDAISEDFHPPKEILKCYSTFEGFVAYRGEKGSPYIKIFCDEIKKKGNDTSIDEIMKSVIKTVSTETRGKQIPSYMSSLTKPFIFGDYV